MNATQYLAVACNVADGLINGVFVQLLLKGCILNKKKGSAI